MESYLVYEKWVLSVEPYLELKRELFHGVHPVESGIELTWELFHGAEGFDGRSNKEFSTFLGYAYRSASEVQSHLYVALDQNYLNQENFDKLYKQTEQVKKLINGFIRYLDEKEDS